MGVRGLSLIVAFVLALSSVCPAAAWNTFLGSSTYADNGRAVAVDGGGNVYVLGYSPLGWGSPLAAHTGNGAPFVAKLTSSGTLLWHTFFGSASIDDGFDLALDGGGNVYIVGNSGGTWGSPARAYTADLDGFVAKLDSSGTLLWSTFLGGTGVDTTVGVAVDGSGNVYVGGSSSVAWGSPLNGFAGMYDAFLARLDGGTGGLTWLTFIGSSSYDDGGFLALDGSGNIYLAGRSSATWGTPVREHAGGGPTDAFVAKLTPSGGLSWNTFLGSTVEDQAAGIAVGSSVFVTGLSYATWGLPVRDFGGGPNEGFVAKLDTSGTMQWHTFLGGNNYDNTKGIAATGDGGAVVAGCSWSSWGTPLRAYLGLGGASDAFAAKVDAGGSVEWNYFVGGNVFDSAADVALGGDGAIYLTGSSDTTWDSPILPIAGSTDAFVHRLPPINRAPTDISLSPSSIAENQPPVTVVGSFSTTDPDAGDAFTYSLVSGTGSGDNTSFSISESQLRANASFDYESRSSYAIRVRTTDAGGLWYEEAVTVSVTNVNEPPTAVNDTATTPEDTPIDIPVLDNDTDPDALADLQFVDPPIVCAALFPFRCPLPYTPPANFCGTDSISYTMTDGEFQDSAQVTVTVTCVNDPPTLDAIPDPTAIDEDAGTQYVSLWGISEGPGESQNVTVTATSSNTAVIPHPSVSYSSPATNGTISYAPVANASGTSVVTVTVNDGQAQNNTFSRTFTVTVNPVNDAPTINAIPNPTAIPEDSGQQTVNLAGISAGGGESQTLTVTASSSNTSLIPDPTVTYASPNATGSLSYTPVANAFGTATVTVIVNDGQPSNGTASRTFTVSVSAVNDPPTLDAIADPAAIPEDAGQQTVNLTGISAGPLESQTMTVGATSSNTALIPHPTVTYASPSATGSLRYTPVANASGSATVTVTVNDGQASNNTATRTFTVAVSPVNDPPTLDAIPNPAAILEDAGQQTVNLTGISAGGGESQTLTVTASSSNPSLIPDPTVTYASPDVTGSLAYTPLADTWGTADITVTVDDGQASDRTVTRTFTVTVTNNPLDDPVPPVLARLATRGRVTAANPLRAGFTVQGTVPKRLVFRGLGPSLGVAGALANPVLRVYSGDTLVGSNDNWGTLTPSDRATLAAEHLTPANAYEAALVLTLAAPGPYTVQLSGPGTAAGIGQVEVYDAGAWGN